MAIQTFLHKLARVILFGAIATNLLAFIELVLQLANISLIGSLYTPGRLIELAAALLVLVIAILLFEIRDALQAKV